MYDRQEKYLMQVPPNFKEAEIHKVKILLILLNHIINIQLHVVHLINWLIC
jgi:hypothetical protein